MNNIKDKDFDSIQTSKQQTGLRIELMNFGYLTESIYITSVIEYFASEVLYLSEECSLENKHNFIYFPCVIHIIHKDKELKQLFQKLNIKLPLDKKIELGKDKIKKEKKLKEPIVKNKKESIEDKKLKASYIKQRSYHIYKIDKINDQMNPQLKLSIHTNIYINKFLNKVAVKILENRIGYGKYSVQNSVIKLLPGELHKHAVKDGNKVYKIPCKRSIKRMIFHMENIFGDVFEKMYFTFVLEYLTAELLELSGNIANDEKMKIIYVPHILKAINKDEELKELFKYLQIKF